ncbi:MAG: UDP-4-amino-4,6-dideoxy-N-acetyl-beta-L-altrosamine N-acetyltransferase [Pseudomonadales bacterium]|jgi:UDP-4-amino-4,6-dideoxy-N-acetyl-beta-L-altrosamine N-acetyltransferase|nr:UDP-4-amino-4,6-dideoxy-N-acetyl-beta-L-altrosamine N-acetyltransferase [Pseudomonadales bacterium]
MTEEHGLGRLRPVEEGDLEAMLAWRNAPVVREKMYTRHEISLEEHRAWWTATRQREDRAYFVYECDDVPLGIVGFTDMDPVDRIAAWAFYASPQAPRGTGGRMEYLALEYAFSFLGLEKLYCEVLDFNDAVVRMHEKFGFQREGLFREQHVYGNDRIGIVRMGLLRREWEARRDAARARVGRR